jgi:hypothetical protein
MIDISSVDFTVDAPPIGEERLAARANALFDAWDGYLGGSLPVDDYYLRFELAEGSLKGRGRVAVAAVALYGGIATFGSFMSGVREIAHISRAAGDYLLEQADHQLEKDRRGPVRGHKTAAQLARLETLFVRVRRGELTPKEATVLADQMFEDEELPSGFIRDLHETIQEIPRRAKQLNLDLDYPVLTAAEPIAVEVPSRPDRAPPVPPIPPPALFRVEVWRESKKERRHISIEPL